VHLWPFQCGSARVMHARCLQVEWTVTIVDINNLIGGVSEQSSPLFHRLRAATSANFLGPREASHKQRNLVHIESNRNQQK
jgi:hypothetical protein